MSREKRVVRNATITDAGNHVNHVLARKLLVNRFGIRAIVRFESHYWSSFHKLHHCHQKNIAFR